MILALRIFFFPAAHFILLAVGQWLFFRGIGFKFHDYSGMYPRL